MSMSNIPDFEPKICMTTLDALNIILASIGFEELGLANILNAEGDKIQAFLGTLECQTKKREDVLDDLLKLNNNVTDTLNAITRKEMILLMKLDSTLGSIKKTKK